MPVANSNTASLQYDYAPLGRRSASGASTASNDTSTAVDSTADADPKYAPIRPRSRHTLQGVDLSRTATPSDAQGSTFDDMGLSQLSQYNNGGQAANDPSLHGQHVDAMNFEMSGIGSHDGNPYGHTQVNSIKQPNRAPSRSASSLGNATGAEAEKKERRGGNNTQANEKELRELIERNHDRTLESIARDVRNAERTQKSEKAKQLFAMRWLRQYCKTSTDSVPRNRVYTHYAQRCGTERVDTLNPASFGKLVRIIFPGIQTRRLGVRGESKYHYVSLTLVEDPSTHTRPRSAANSPQMDIERETPFEESEFSVNHRMPIDTAAFPTQDMSFDNPPMVAVESNPPSQGRLFAPPQALGGFSDAPKLYRRRLKFSASDSGLSQDEALELPPIQQHLPPKTDSEIADALTALYRTHCNSIVDSVRYVKEKQFARLLGAFNGTMTVPVSRLFQQPGMEVWIRACDQIMYQQIIRFVSQLALQVIPVQVFNMLRNVSTELADLLHKHFGHFPEHVLHAKLEAATIFSSLLSRMLRVNETAHAAANLLMSDEMRNVMWQDWVRYVRPKRVVESALSTCGHEESYKIITTEMRHLLAPLAPSEWVEFSTEYQTSTGPDEIIADWMTKTDTRAENIIERWAVFLQSIPSRFPRAQTKLLMQAMESVGNACLRDLTVAQAQSFGAWWITKVWIDEMMLWTAEMGGFLGPQNDGAASPSRSEHFDSMGEGEQRDSMMDQHPPDRAASAGPRPDSAGLGIDFSAMPSFTPLVNRHRHSSGPPTATFRFPASKPNPKTDVMTFDFNDAHDDSGIGMSLLADNSPRGFSPGQSR